MADKDCGSKPGHSEKMEGLPVLRCNVAGIDIGSMEHWVCAPALGEAGREVRAFGATTPELEKLAQWLKERGVESVALESTGVYWIALHEILERHGLDDWHPFWQPCRSDKPEQESANRLECCW